MNGVPIARIFGFEVRLHISWLFIIAIENRVVAAKAIARQRIFWVKMLFMNYRPYLKSRSRISRLQNREQ